jgi:hypothetical protein
VSVEAALLELFESQVQLAPMTELRRDGHPTTGDAVTIVAHLQFERHKVMTQGGEEAVAEGMVLLDGVYSWADVDCVLTLPDGSSPPLVAVETLYGPNLDTGTSGPYMTKLHFGR